MTEQLLLTPEEVAASLGIGRTTIYDMLRRGDIPSLKLGRARRVAVADLKRYVDQQRADQSIVTADSPTDAA